MAFHGSSRAEAPTFRPWGEAEAVEAVAEDAETAETGGRCGDGRDGQRRGVEDLRIVQ